MIYVNRDVVNYFADKLTGKTDTNVMFTNELITDEKLVQAVMRFFEQLRHGSCPHETFYCN
jgi:hypothetical protein